MTKFSKSTSFLNERLIVSTYFFSKSFSRIHSAITILDVSLKEYTLNVEILLTVALFNDNLYVFNFLSNKFHLISL